MKLKPEILFVYLDYSLLMFKGATYHLGSGYVQAYLRQRGVNTQQLLANSRPRLTDLVDMILQQQPRVVGFTCYDSNYYTSKLIAQLLKRERPEITVLMGGPSATFSDQLIMRDTQAVDACIRGEGEQTMGEIVERLRQGPKLTGIRGVTHRQGDQVVREADRPRGGSPTEAGGLDIFPSPLLAGVFPLEEMAPGEIDRVGISTSRGCPYRCIYCNFAAMSGHQVRYHSLDRVIAELKAIDGVAKKRLAPGEKLGVTIHDDALTLNIKRAKRLCRRISELGLKQIKLSCETRADHVDLELLELMHQAGFEEINFGLESAVPRVLRVIKKVSPTPSSDKNLMPERRFVRQIKRVVSWCQQVGIEPTVSIILGLPTETLEEGKATLEFVKKIGIRDYYHNYLRVYPGTEIFEKQVEYGVKAIVGNRTLPYTTCYSYNVHQLGVIDGQELCDTRGVILRRHFLYHLQRLIGAQLDRNYFPLQNILLRNVHLISQDFFQWITKFSSLSSRVSIMNDEQDTLQWEDSIENMVQAGFPLLGFTCVVPGNQWTPAVPEYVWFHGILPDEPYYKPYLRRFYFVPFSKLGKLEEATLGISRRKRVIFFSLSSEQDRRDLIKLSERVIQQGFSALPRQLLDSQCSFINECCWWDEPCPASNLHRLIVDSNGDIRPCFQGQSVGQVGWEPEQIKQKLLKQQQVQSEERGCQRCPVRDKCSKCLSPPLPIPEFCQLKLKHPSIVSLVKIMPYVRNVVLYNHLPPKTHGAIFGHLAGKDRHKLELLTRVLGLKAGPLTNQMKREVLITTS